MATESANGDIRIPQDPIPLRDLERHVVEVLQSGGLKQDTVKQMARAVASLNGAGFRPVKVFPKGIPFPDGTWVQTFVPLEGAARFLELLRELPQIDEIRIFPKGIPVPDVLHAEIGMR